ncbi:hyalin-like isoform X2 [Amphiura filiformis]|uniref:hyalin-like isoform X2 n=1 Tax=Amphiura filiformis TaxID=82378 RepID=UPI003B2156FE
MMLFFAVVLLTGISPSTGFDGEPPIVVCPGGDISTTTCHPAGTADIKWLPCTARDNSGTANFLSQSHQTGQLFAVGRTEVTYTFQDPSNNRASGSFFVTVTRGDECPPKISGPPDIKLATHLGSSGQFVTYGEPTPTDNSGIYTLVERSHSPGALFPIGTTTVRYVFQDLDGNIIAYEFHITVVEVDFEPPNVVCPNDLARTTACNSMSTADITWQPCTATDNSGTATLVSQSHQTGQFFAVGRTEVTYTYRDPSYREASGSFFVIVNEGDECPPGDITVTTPLGTDGRSVTYTEPTATDNSGIYTLVERSHSPGERFPIGTTTVRYVFQGLDGNIMTHEFDITVVEVDLVPPSVTCPNDVRVATCNIFGTPDVTWQPCTATDNSGAVTLISQTHHIGQIFPRGGTQVTYIFADPSGNRASGSFSVLVASIDGSVPPHCTNTPQDITMEVTPGTGGTTVSYNEPGATTYCVTFILQSQTHAPGDFFNIGRTRVTYIFTSPGRFTLACAFYVDIIEVDLVPPSVTCPNDVIVTTCGLLSTDVTWQPCTATDNSGAVTLVSQTHQSGQFFLVGVTQVTYIFADQSGNKANGSFSVIIKVVDGSLPGCSARDITREITPGTGGTTVSYNEPEAYHVCDRPTFTLLSQTHAPGDFFNIGRTRVIYFFFFDGIGIFHCAFYVDIIEVSNCTEDQYTCSDGSCIPQDWVCDGINDCYLAVDEHNCDACLSQPCQNEGVCSIVRNRYTCSCPPRFTGINCDVVSNCTEDQYSCPDGRCIPQDWVCDGINDCYLAVDEHNCDSDDCLPQPCQNGGICSDGDNSYTCYCRRGFVGLQCEHNINECSSQPCRNSGTCLDGDNMYTCQCPMGFTGTQCETYINECSSQPCRNSGTCLDGDNMYTCQCPMGFTGTQCETYINECSSQPCRNSGTCLDGDNMYTCQCPMGFTGTQCETYINECSSQPCRNSGTCLDGDNMYTCQCPMGFTGTQCETYINECSSQPCRNSGTCLDGDNMYTCQCPMGFTGTQCETYIDDCASQPCLNGGTCFSSNHNSYACRCTKGFTGTQCEDVDSDPITCPSSPVVVTNGAFSIPRPVTNFPVQDTNIKYFYWDSDNTTRQFGFRQPSQATHSFEDVPTTVTMIGAIAFGTSSHTQDSCYFTIQHVSAGLSGRERRDSEVARPREHDENKSNAFEPGRNTTTSIVEGLSISTISTLLVLIIAALSAIICIAYRHIKTKNIDKAVFAYKEFNEVKVPHV